MKGKKRRADYRKKTLLEGRISSRFILEIRPPEPIKLTQLTKGRDI